MTAASPLLVVPLVLDGAGITVASASTTAPGTEIPSQASRQSIDWANVPPDFSPRWCRLVAQAKGSSTLVGFTVNVRDISGATTVATAAAAAGTAVGKLASAWTAFAKPTTERDYGVFAQSITTVSSPVLYVVSLQFR